jgi:glycosyltransferase involved in cell wall biosynthesis
MNCELLICLYFQALSKVFPLCNGGYCYGVPVIATNIAGTSELIEDGRTGLLVRPSDSQALLDAIARMAHDYDFRLHAAKVARRKVVDEFDVDKESRKLKACLLE